MNIITLYSHCIERIILYVVGIRMNVSKSENENVIVRIVCASGIVNNSSIKGAN